MTVIESFSNEDDFISEGRYLSSHRVHHLEILPLGL